MIKLFLDSLTTAIFGIVMVFSVLVFLIVLIVILSKLIHKFMPDKSETVAVASKPVVSAASATATPVNPQALKLKGVDEKTAAMIMAIVCDESGIPANELYFKSITLLES